MSDDSSRNFRLDPAQPLRLSVDRHDVVRVSSSVAYSVRSLRGHTWLTRDRQLRDEVLSPGQTLELPAGAEVRLSGLPAALVDIAAQRRAA
jgi:hypothetical protein